MSEVVCVCVLVVMYRLCVGRICCRSTRSRVGITGLQLSSLQNKTFDSIFTFILAFIVVPLRVCRSKRLPFRILLLLMFDVAFR